MARRRLPALLALLAGLLLGAGAGAQGLVASADVAHTGRTISTTHHVRSESVTGAHNDALSPVAPRPASTAVARGGHGGTSGRSLRDVAVLPALALLGAALLASLVRQRRRSRPPGWHRSTLFARGPPLLLAR